MIIPSSKKRCALLEAPTLLPHRIPIKPIDNVIVPSVSRWHIVKSNEVTKLRKVYSFDDAEKKSSFVFGVFAKEEETQHPVDILVCFDIAEDKTNVTIDLYTRGINSITDTDKSIAAYFDILFHDIAYNLN